MRVPECGRACMRVRAYVIQRIHSRGRPLRRSGRRRRVPRAGSPRTRRPPASTNQRPWCAPQPLSSGHMHTSDPRALGVALVASAVPAQTWKGTSRVPAQRAPSGVADGVGLRFLLGSEARSECAACGRRRSLRRRSCTLCRSCWSDYCTTSSSSSEQALPGHEPDTRG